MKRILLVEDNRVVSRTIEVKLVQNGFKVDCAYNAEDGLVEFTKYKYNAIILDLHLPKMSGYMFLQILRKKSDVPVIINTSYANVKTRVKMINVGASDFIEKTLHPDEILESLKIILENQEEMVTRYKIVTYKDLEINFSTRKAKKNGTDFELTTKEFDILKTLFDNPNRAFSRKQLYLIVWGEEYYEGFDNTINVHVKRLRNKIEDLPNKPEIIETVYAFGYRLGQKVIEELSNNN